MELASFITSKSFIFLLIAITILSIIIWILYLKNRKMYEEIVKEKEKLKKYISSINEIKSSPKSAEEDFRKFNRIVRNFFKEYFDLGYHLTYLELENEFQKMNKPEYVKFCRVMSDLNYTGKKIERENLDKLVNYFSYILERFYKL